LEILRAQPEPTTLAALVTLTGLHENTVREHLTALGQLRLVRRERAAPAGRGRPAWLYTATQEGPEATEYAGLAVALAGAIAENSPSPREAALEAGRRWGAELVGDSPGSQESGPAESTGRVVALLDDLGFAPEATTGGVRLTRCPLLEAAHRHRDVVCGVHLGLVQGALEQAGADSTGVELIPFFEAGACWLGLPQPAVTTGAGDE
jgi:predicted ArsR family transcriptional regulator